MSLYQDKLVEQLSALVEYPHWLVAYSGGLDSTVLLNVCHRFLLSSGHLSQAAHPLPQLQAIHVDHQLSPNHLSWVNHCESQCRTLGVPLQVTTVEVSRQGSLEQAARNARYAAFTEYLQHCPNNTLLLLAHHIDDQAETVLLRILRGSGVRGASAMPIQRTFEQAILARPLLNISKQQLLAYAAEQSLSWIEDESNDSNQFDRNYLRKEILPALQRRWPETGRLLARFAEHAREADQLSNELARLDFASVCSPDTRFGASLTLSALLDLTVCRRKNLYRYWLDQQNTNLPDARRLKQLDDWLLTRPLEGQQLLGDYSFRIYRQRLYLVDEAWLEAQRSELAAPEKLTLPGQTTVSSWRGFSLTIKSGVTGLAPGDYTVAVRQRNKHLLVNGQHKTVHKIMQAMEIPTWLRDIYPVIYHHHEIAAIGLTVADRYRADKGFCIECVLEPFA